MTAYQKSKEEARQKAINYQYKATYNNYSYYTIYIISNYFYELGKKYGLLKEFRQNGIL